MPGIMGVAPGGLALVATLSSPEVYFSVAYNELWVCGPDGVELRYTFADATGGQFHSFDAPNSIIFYSYDGLGIITRYASANGGRTWDAGTIWIAAGGEAVIAVDDIFDNSGAGLNRSLANAAWSVWLTDADIVEFLFTGEAVYVTDTAGSLRRKPLIGGTLVATDLASGIWIRGAVGPDTVLVQESDGTLTRVTGLVSGSQTGLPALQFAYPPVLGGGAYWCGLGYDGVTSMAVLYEEATPGNTIYRSVDDGLTWTALVSFETPLFGGAPGWSIPVFCGTSLGIWWVPSVVEATVNGFLRSADNGDTWAFVPLPTGVQPMDVHSAGRPSITVPA